MAIIDKKQTRWYAKSTFDSLDKTTIPVGTEIQVTGEIEEADLTADLQTKINGKLTAPTTPTADSVVTMAANGTTGTKALSEFGGKLYRHKIIVSFTGGDGTTSAYLYIYSSKSTAYEKNNYSEIKGFYTAACDSSSNGGAVSIYFNASSGLVSGVVYGMLMGQITYLNDVGIEDFSDIVTEL